MCHIIDGISSICLIMNIEDGCGTSLKDIDSIANLLGDIIYNVIKRQFPTIYKLAKELKGLKRLVCLFASYKIEIEI